MNTSLKKERIVQESRSLFEKYGYRKTTLTDIAKSIGYVKSAIYYYFNGKEEIFEFLVQKEAEKFVEKLAKTINKHATPEEKLFAYIDTRINLMEKIANRYQFLKKDFFELIPLVEKNRIQFDEIEINLLSPVILALNKNIPDNRINPEYTANLLMQILKGLEIQMFVTNTVNAHKQDRKAFIDFLLYGLIRN